MNDRRISVALRIEMCIDLACGYPPGTGHLDINEGDAGRKPYGPGERRGISDKLRSILICREDRDPIGTFIQIITESVELTAKGCLTVKIARQRGQAASA